MHGIVLASTGAAPTPAPAGRAARPRSTRTLPYCGPAAHVAAERLQPLIAQVWGARALRWVGMTMDPRAIPVHWTAIRIAGCIDAYEIQRARFAGANSFRRCRWAPPPACPLSSGRCRGRTPPPTPSLQGGEYRRLGDRYADGAWGSVRTRFTSSLFRAWM